MKFHTAILSLAILGTFNNNNNSYYIDAKIWSLRGLGRSTTNNNNQDVIQGGSLIKEEEEQSATLPTNHKNLGDYLFGEERNLGKKDKKKKGEGGKKMKGQEEEVKPEVVKTEEEGGKDGKKKKKGEGEKSEKRGEEIFIDAPEDVKRKHDACDADEEEVTARRVLKKKKGKKEDKKTMSDGQCDNCEFEDDDEEGNEESGLAKAVEASAPSCDPDDGLCTEEDDDSALPGEDRSPDDEEEEAEGLEAIERRLMDPRRLTGNTAGIGQFTPLTCNPEVFDCSSPASLATLVTNAAGGEVKVPCGQCYVVSVLLYLLIIVGGRGGEAWICYIYFWSYYSFNFN